MLENLRDAVLKNPDDLQAVHVWADALLESGHPLGDIVRTSVTEAGPRRALEREEWLAGRLRASADAITLHRGLLWGIALKRLTPTGYRRLVGRDEWRTVRTIQFNRGVTERTSVLPPEAVTELLTHPVMSGVRELTAFDLNALRMLGKQKTVSNIESAEVVCSWDQLVPTDALPALARLRTLRLVQVGEAQAETLMGSSLVRQLHWLAIDFRGAHLAIPALSRLLSAPTGLNSFNLGDLSGTRHAGKWSITFTDHGQHLEAFFMALDVVSDQVALLTLVTPKLAPEAKAFVATLASATGCEVIHHETLAAPGDDYLPF